MNKEVVMRNIFGITSLAILAIYGNAHAIERLTPIVEPKGKPAPAPTLDKSKQKAWLGVAGQPVAEALAAQLGIGHGITIELVSPDGSAFQSGIKKFDIITRIGEQEIASMRDLRQSINEAAVNDVLDIEVFTGGKKELKKVKLGARPAHLPAVSATPMKPPSIQSKKLPQALQHLPANDRVRIEEMMEQQIQQMQKHFSQMDAQFEDLQHLHNQSMQIDPNTIRMKGHSNYSGTFTMMDNEGSIRLTLNEQQGKQVEVKDRSGQVLYAGPYETDEDKMAVPAEIRSRIEALGMDQQAQRGGLKFHFGR